MKKIIFITTISLSLWGNAQETSSNKYRFSLSEAVNFGVEHNYSILNASKDIAAAKEKKRETTTIGLPQINAAIGYQNNIVLQKSLIPAEIFGGQPGEFAEVAFGTKQNMAASATLSQLLFNGSYLVGLESAKVYLKISENAKIKTNNEIKELIIASYCNVLLAEETIVIIEKNKISLEKLLFQTTETYKNGLIEEENVEQLQITLSSVNNALENIKRQKNIALNMLKLVMGMSMNDELALTEKLEKLAVSSVNLDIIKSNFEVTNHIDYKIQDNVINSNKLLVKLEKSKALPTLAAAYNIGYNAFGNQFKFLSAEQRWLNYSNVGVSLNIPIFSSFARSSRTQQAKIALEQAQTKMIQTEQTLKLQFEKAKSDYEYSLQQLVFSKNSLSLSERIEQKQEVKFKEGLSSSFILNEAQRQLYSNQQNYLQALLDVIVKKASLEKMLN
ncbi:transporter [Flavobacterium branchiophilum]|uniref:Outer membrane protein TolC n=1 Tax=Flavobacterium branchiophilum TaxID=55197 RepID=A0A543G4J4_9FLAO|nr:TolC family protein [Flavobacterium branchiophilum]OXA71837.1 transporter [Flavobacterium branchiophilum] [Flavobacterium branchiophilum NBRC 15030 = ATCC 35035]TQM40989.1 outer membrane protein TolC [Flavobacterium branchiophilum]GEM56150.1 transporter [Flavobacterium branchiophilum NBRC 15030 = ATCC 35035]